MEDSNRLPTDNPGGSAKSGWMTKGFTHGFSEFLAFAAGIDPVLTWVMYALERLQYLHFFFALVVCTLICDTFE